MITAIIRIDYEEFVPGSYEQVEVWLYENHLKQTQYIFKTGNVVRDFHDASEFAAANSSMTILTSSCDAFTQDNPEYGWDNDEYIVRLGG